MALLLLALLMLLALQLSDTQVLNLRNGSSNGWNGVAKLDQLDAQDFKAFVYPLVQIAANAYRHPEVIPIPGWIPASKVKPLAPANGGAHAVVYTEEQGERLVIGFRGTDMESVADQCCDILLFGHVPWDGEPSESTCAKYSSETLDYYTQALHYTKQVIDAYPEAPLLLTGHSLGAALAILVSASFSEVRVLPVVAFGGPGMKKLLEKKSLQLIAEKHHQVFVVGDEWDIIMRGSWDNQVGTLCLYEEVESAECIACSNKTGFYDGHLNRRALESVTGTWSQICFTCFLQTHYMAHVIELVESGTKPSCEQVDMVLEK